MDKNILVIGAPNSGKTHYGGQLYGRLKSKKCEFKLRETPDDLSIFQEILKKLNNGIPGDHTPSSESKELLLPIISTTKQSINIVYPDYGGEQVKEIIDSRKINAKWQMQINSSTDWILFIRPNLIESIADITTRFYSHIPSNNGVHKPEQDGLKANSQMFYIELLQMLLFVKKENRSKVPFLQVFLSCCDEFKFEEQTPKEYLKTRMPLLYDYILNTWEGDFSIIGLSATGICLDTKNPNEDFILDGPEESGYIITEDGELESDLTKSLKRIIEA